MKIKMYIAVFFIPMFLVFYFYGFYPAIISAVIGFIAVAIAKLDF